VKKGRCCPYRRRKKEGFVWGEGEKGFAPEKKRRKKSCESQKKGGGGHRGRKEIFGGGNVGQTKECRKSGRPSNKGTLAGSEATRNTLGARKKNRFWPSGKCLETPQGGRTAVSGGG